MSFSKSKKNPDFGHFEVDSGPSEYSRTLKNRINPIFCLNRSGSENGLRVAKIGIFVAFRKIHIISFQKCADLQNRPGTRFSSPGRSWSRFGMILKFSSTGEVAKMTKLKVDHNGLLILDFGPADPH